MDLRYERAQRARALVLPKPWCSTDVVIVLPTYEEVANLPVMAAALFDLPMTGLRILVVDDNSPDGTGRIAEQLVDAYGRHRLEVMHRAGTEGLGRAYVADLSRVLAKGAEVVVQMDCDLSHGPQYVPQMPGTLLSADADVVIGSRHVARASVGTDRPWYRKTLSGFANANVLSLLRLRIRDATAGYKLWWGSALEAIDLGAIRSEGYKFQVEMNYQSIQRGLKIIELPIHFLTGLRTSPR